MLIKVLIICVFKVSENVEISRNSYSGNEVDGRSDGSFLDTVEDYLKGHDFSFKVPFVESQVKISPRNIDKDELDISVKFDEEPSEAKSSGVSRNYLIVFFYIYKICL